MLGPLHALALTLALGCPYVSDEDLELRQDRDGDGYDHLEDCDDLDPEKNPGAREYCDGVDNDCDGRIDEDWVVLYTDEDGDGFGVVREQTSMCWQLAVKQPGLARVAGDCNDLRADVRPGAESACDGDSNCNDVDFDCDGVVDCDADADGLSDCSCGGSDVDDLDPEVLDYGFDWVDGCDDNLDGEPDVFLTDQPDILVEGTLEDWYVGSSVSLHRDLDGDGIQDLVVGAKRADGPGEDGERTEENAGAVWVVYGPITDEVIRLEATDLDADERLASWYGISSGQSLSSVLVGDLDGDWAGDFVFGCTEAEGGVRGTGSLHIFPGPFREQDGVSVEDASFALMGQREGDTIGERERACVLDFTGDGLDDLVVGSPCSGSERDDCEEDAEGAVWVLPGPFYQHDWPGELETPELHGDIIQGVRGVEQVGLRIHPGGDIDGDGYDELLVATEASEAKGDGRGRAYLVFGWAITDGATLEDYPSGATILEIGGVEADQGVGNQVVPLGDIDNDTIPDVLVGSHSEFFVYTGQRLVECMGGALDTDHADAILDSQADLSAASRLPQPAVGGDLNGDGVDDFAIADHQRAVGDLEGAGVVSIFFGSER